MKDQKTLKELYKENLKLAWDDPKMVDYCSKKAEQIVETEDGWLIEVERQNIKKHFCFGHGYCGVTTEEEMHDAFKMADHARTQASYFINENLKFYNDYLKDLKNEDNDVYVSQKGKYWTQKPGCKLQNFTIDTHSWYGYRENYKDNTKWKLMSKNDRNELIAAFERAKDSFVKRLNTYLKKFGLSKLSVWTYLVD